MRQILKLHLCEFKLSKIEGEEITLINIKDVNKAMLLIKESKVEFLFVIDMKTLQ